MAFDTPIPLLATPIGVALSNKVIKKYMNFTKADDQSVILNLEASFPRGENQNDLDYRKPK